MVTDPVLCCQEISAEQPHEEEEGIDMDVLLQEDIREAGVRLRCHEVGIPWPNALRTILPNPA